MNKTEAEWASMLEARRISGEVVWWAFELIKLKLADNTFYTPDFQVLLATGEMQIHEVKGAHVMDDARVKFKVASETFPYRFVWAQKVKGGAWNVEVMP